MEPKYPLEKVVIAAREGDLLLAFGRARAIVADYIEGLVDAERFARAVIGSLRKEDFVRTVELTEPPYKGLFDEYLAALGADLIELHGLGHVPDWYVKLKLTESDDGDSVVCISLHPAERPKKRRPNQGKKA